MALALATTSALTQVTPQSPSSMSSVDLDYRIIVSTEPHFRATHLDAYLYDERLSPLSPEESEDDMPLSPITFKRNEEYERSRLSYIPPPLPRPSSSPSSPNTVFDISPMSPVIFSQPNLSSPSIVSESPPVFPRAGTQSLAVRLKRPLPPLPKVDTGYDSDATAARSRPGLVCPYNITRPSPSSSDERGSVSMFSPAESSQSPATSVYTTASSDSMGSSKAMEAFPSLDSKPKVPPLMIPARSYSTPLTQSKAPPIGSHIVSPHISVTPASPLPPQQFAFAPRSKKRSASTTSIVIPSPYEGRQLARESEPDLMLSRAASPTPSLAPSMASIKSFTKEKASTLRRMASKTRLFGRRTLSSASEPAWDADDDDDGEETIIGHEPSGSLSLDDKLLRPSERARSESFSTLGYRSSGEMRSVDEPNMRFLPTLLRDTRQLKRVEVAQVTVTPEGDIWEPLELQEVIPKLRQLRAPARIKM